MASSHIQADAMAVVLLLWMETILRGGCHGSVVVVVVVVDRGEEMGSPTRGFERFLKTCQSRVGS